MNKQEVLEELETTSTQFFHVATSTGVEANNKTLSTGVFAGLGIAKSVLTKLDEPKKVKARLAKHWDEDLGDCLWWNFPVEEPPYCGTPLDDDFPKYKTHFTELHIPDEVEEEPKWVVKFQNKHELPFYFDHFNGLKGKGNQYFDFAYTTKEKAERFIDKSIADSVATLVNGTVEKV